MLQSDPASLDLRRLSANLPGFLYQYRVRPDGSSHFPFATSGIVDVYGCRPEDVTDDAAAVLRVLHPNDAAGVLARIEQSRRELTHWSDRYRVRHPTRGTIWIAGDARPERTPDGSTVWHGYLRDVTADQAREERLQLLGTVFTSSLQGVLITDARGRIVEVNDAFRRLSGYGREELTARNPSIFSSGRHDQTFYAAMWRALRECGHWQGEIWNRRKDGTLLPELMSIDGVRGPGGEISHYVAIYSDISQIKEHQDELERIAHFDALTGLPNRRLLGEQLERALTRARVENSLVAVCFVDLDGFKAINDTHGHAVGDALLRIAAERLRGAVKQCDTVARVGGDEFVLVINGLHARADVFGVLDRVLAAIGAPARIGNVGAQVSGSIGVALFPELGHADELLRAADQAMYRAKQQGRNCHVLFDAAENGAMQSRQVVLRDLAAALERGELMLYVQPEVDLRSGRVLAAEALIRWRRPDGSVRLPGEFMPALAGHALEGQVGAWVLQQALALQKRWAAEGLDLSISINVSVEHMLDGGFVAQLEAALRGQPGLDPGKVIVEILENTRVGDYGRMRERVLACRQLGVRCALDDFGTGYSSMTHLRQLPVDQVKIDQSFVRGMLDNEEDANIVEGIIGLARAFDRQVVAEGAETAEHLLRLEAMGCQRAQGYAIARPMPGSELPAWVARWRSGPRPVDAQQGHAPPGEEGAVNAA